MWCWGRLLRVPWTARRSNQSILKEISPEYSLEGLKLKLQYFGHLMWRTVSLEKTMMLGKIEGGRRRGWQRMRWLDGIPIWWTWIWANSRSLWLKAGGEGDDREWDGWMASRYDEHEFEQTPGVYDGQGSLVCCSPWGHKDWVTELNWTDCLNVKQTKQKCRYIQWIYSVEVFSRILFCSTFIYEIEVYAKYVQMVTDHYSYMTKMSCDKCYKVHRNTVGRAELFFADYRGTADLLWRRQWHPTPVLLPGNSYGQRSLVGCNPWGC